VLWLGKQEETKIAMVNQLAACIEDDRVKSVVRLRAGKAVEETIMDKEVLEILRGYMLFIIY